MESRSLASKCAFAAMALFVTGMTLVIALQPPATFAGSPPPLVIVTTLAFTFFHLALLPVIAALDAPVWAKGSGYAWIVVDNVIVFMSYFGVGAELIIPMRWGVHLAAATWIFGASASATGLIKNVGLLTVVAFLAATFAGPFVGREMAGQTLGPSGLGLVIWLVLVGRKLSTPR